MSPSAASSGNALTGGSSSTSPHPLGIPSSDLKPAVTRKPKTRKQNQQTKENKLIVEICKQLEQQANIRTTKQNKNQKNKKTKKQKNKKTKQKKKQRHPRRHKITAPTTHSPHPGWNWSWQPCPTHPRASPSPTDPTLPARTTPRLEKPWPG